MIFCSRNERGELAADLVMAGRKTVTRRMKPVEIGKVLAVQPGRGKKALEHVKVISCHNSLFWWQCNYVRHIHRIHEFKNEEAAREGFETWDGLCRWLEEHKIQMAETYRIEFELVRP